MSEADIFLGALRGFFAEVEGHEVIYITTMLAMLLWKWMDSRRSPRICRADLLELAAQFQQALTDAFKEFKGDLSKQDKKICDLAQDVAFLRGKGASTESKEGGDEKK